jgi:hypothetical protein
MRIGYCITAAGLLALAACGSSEVKLQPGEWEMKMETVNVTAPGMPASVTAAMKQPAATSRSCITPEEAEGPKGDMFAGNVGANCKQEGFSWAGGRIKGTTTCTGSNGAGKVSMTMDGTYSAQAMDMNMKMTTEAAGTPMTVETRMTGKRVGDCAAPKAG